nr:hypothetical protein [Candidatus Freyrarchaeum guaymaensis]
MRVLRRRDGGHRSLSTIMGDASRRGLASLGGWIHPPPPGKP